MAEMIKKPTTDGVSEMGGVWAGQGLHTRWVSLCQFSNGIGIGIGTTGADAIMTVFAARSLARQLYRLARRNELRDAK